VKLNLKIEAHVVLDHHVASFFPEFAVRAPVFRTFGFRPMLFNDDKFAPTVYAK